MKNDQRSVRIYQGLKAKFPNHVVAPSYIRMEQYLTNGQSEYAFPLKKLGNESPTENKLNEQDAFLVSGIGIFLMKESILVGGISELYTYPNATAIPDEGAGLLVSKHLEHIYNGSVVAKVGDTIYLPDFPIMGCRSVNTSQQTTAANFSERHSHDGILDLTPQFTFKGRENNELKLRVPANSNQKVSSVPATTGYNTKVCMYLVGYKITGAGQNTGA